MKAYKIIISTSELSHSTYLMIFESEETDEEIIKELTKIGVNTGSKFNASSKFKHLNIVYPNWSIEKIENWSIKKGPFT